MPKLSIFTLLAASRDTLKATYEGRLSLFGCPGLGDAAIWEMAGMLSISGEESC